MMTATDTRTELFEMVSKRASHAGTQSDGTVKPLPALAGSEKQSVWASEIRTKMLQTAWMYYFVTFCSKFSLDTDAQVDEQVLKAAQSRATAYRRGIAVLENKSDAKFWIDNRSETGISLVAKVAPIAAQADGDEDDAQQSGKSFPRRDGTASRNILEAHESFGDFIRHMGEAN
jgi:hypothetical protein